VCACVCVGGGVLGFAESVQGWHQLPRVHPPSGPRHMRRTGQSAPVRGADPRWAALRMVFGKYSIHFITFIMIVVIMIIIINLLEIKRKIVFKKCTPAQAVPRGCQRAWSLRGRSLLQGVHNANLRIGLVAHAIQYTRL